MKMFAHADQIVNFDHPESEKVAKIEGTLDTDYTYSPHSKYGQHQPYLIPYSNKIYPLGFVDPLIVVAVIAIPLLALLALGSLMMPMVPIFIYLLTIFCPVGGSGRRKRDITDDSLLKSVQNSLKMFENI
ncbi:uncharacterized protein LOC141858668 isoform X1 [Brevipalpus obovatus]|uniref:uncharacterized protein LOC141858668 isoform X1 n=1 Tax=Brevipalpus obovatus TaxID=246614 RepID=UPI003D9F08D5